MADIQVPNRGASLDNNRNEESSIHQERPIGRRHQVPNKPWEECLRDHYRQKRLDAHPSQWERLEIEEEENMARLQQAEHLRDGVIAPPTQGGFEPAPKPETTDPNNTTIFVGGLNTHSSYHQEILKAIFLVFGHVEYVNLPRDKNCAFVRYQFRISAESAIVKLQGFQLANCAIRLSWGRGPGGPQHKGPGVTPQSMALLIQHIPVADAQPILDAIENVFHGNILDFQKALQHLASSHQLVAQSDALSSRRSRGSTAIPATGVGRTDLRGNRPQAGSTNNMSGFEFNYPNRVTPPDSEPHNWDHRVAGPSRSSAQHVNQVLNAPVFTVHNPGHPQGRNSESSQNSLPFEIEMPDQVAAVSERRSSGSSDPFPPHRTPGAFGQDEVSPPIGSGPFTDPWNASSFHPPALRQTSIPRTQRPEQQRSVNNAVGGPSNMTGHRTPPSYIPRVLSGISPSNSMSDAVHVWASAVLRESPPNASAMATASSNGINPTAMPWIPAAAAPRPM